MNIYEQIDSLYARLPHIHCQRKCQPACGPIMMSPAEWRRIAERVGQTPQPNKDLTCPLLSIMGNCSVYDIRPAICRIYGLTQALSCPAGCVPERWIDDREAFELLQAIRRITGEHQPVMISGHTQTPPPIPDTPPADAGRGRKKRRC